MEYLLNSLPMFSGVVCASILKMASLSATICSTDFSPCAQLRMAQQASKAPRKPRAQPVPVGQNGWRKGKMRENKQKNSSIFFNITTSIHSIYIYTSRSPSPTRQDSSCLPLLSLT